MDWVNQKMVKSFHHMYPRLAVDTFVPKDSLELLIFSNSLCLWCSACMYSCRLVKDTRSHYRWLWATMWLLRIELRTSGRADTALNFWVISPALHLSFKCWHYWCNAITPVTLLCVHFCCARDWTPYFSYFSSLSHNLPNNLLQHNTLNESNHCLIKMLENS